MTLNEKPDPSMKIVKSKTLPPAEGERRAIRGYMGQYERAGAAIYAELERGQLEWIGVADRSAGIADDLVLGFNGLIVGHQFKTSRFPGTFTVQTLLVGADGLLKPLVCAWQNLCSANPTSHVEIRLVVNDYPSVNDAPGMEAPAHSAAFLDEFEHFPKRTLEEWRYSNWGGLVEILFQHSCLGDDDFERFFHALRIIHGSAADFIQFHKLSAEQARLASDIAKILPQLVSDKRDRDRWSCEELLNELGWKDPTKTRHVHRFPIGAHVQRNRDTELQLLQTIRHTIQGYVALIGPPGSGKSTLLQTTLATEYNTRVVRYLAFIPGAAQGVGRGEADDFFEDISAQLRSSGLPGLRLRDSSQFERREQFGELLKQAGERYQRDTVRTIIIVDGLDHIPREELPAHSLLGELPLPAAIPLGVTFILGTQRLELRHLKPAVQEQAGHPDRLVTMHPLERVAVARMADVLGLDSTISRVKLYELSRGHPLAANYLIKALLSADEQDTSCILAGGMEFNGDIESVYASAWREIANDPDVMHVLGFIARIEAPMPLKLLATIVDAQAIERTLKTVRHLLKETSKGWTVFHNSFRLFVLSKPKITLGSIDETYSQHIYRELAELSRHAPEHSLQSWLTLRYLARSGERDELLALATPAYFRHQFAHGRSCSEIDADIHLALIAARSTYDGVIATRLLLCRDEISRRTQALEHANELPRAMLKVGDIDAAISFVQDFPNAGYEVVDLLLEQGDFDRAKELFEHLEPLSQLHTPRFEHYGDSHNLQEFKKWAKRVFHFRDAEQIKQAIDYLTVEGLKHAPSLSTDENITSIREQLKWTVVEAIVNWQADVNIQDTCNQYGIHEQEIPVLMTQAGFTAKDRGNSTLALELFKTVMELPDFNDVSNGGRRSIALFYATSGCTDLASILFENLFAPAISMGDNELESTKALTLAAMEHAQLCVLLGKSLPDVVTSTHAILRPLQTHASETGRLLGLSIINASCIPSGNIQMVCRMVMRYVMQLNSHSGNDTYQAQLALTATSPLICTLIKISALCGKVEYNSVLNEIDNVMPALILKGNTLLRREIALAMYQADGDRERAAARLEPMVNELVENTPSEQLETLSVLANSFAAIGDVDRALNLLASIHDHCLGYALAARKDPLYSVWKDILILANVADPEHRAQRIGQLIQQVDGMKETEGASAAYRLTEVLINEAMRINAHSGYIVAQKLSNWGLIPWPNRVNELIIGMLDRRPEMVFLCTPIWCGLCLPFYIEPYYRDPTHIGNYIDVAANAAGPSSIAKLVSILLPAIQVHSRAHERLTLINRLSKAALRHGYTDNQLDNAITRWTSEAPEARRSYTPQKYDEASTLDELQQAFESNESDPEYHAPYRFCELAESAALDKVVQMYERWHCLQSDARCRFLVAERLVNAGDTTLARKLVDDYDTSSDREMSWSQWLGGNRFRLFHARKLLDGAAIHHEAYEDFISSIVAGKESTMSLLTDMADILPVICESPDWPAVWSILAEQMSFTREHRIGELFEFGNENMTDEELLAELLHFSLRLPITEARRHSEKTALILAVHSTGGQIVFENTITRLLTGTLDEPFQALQILLLLKQNHFAAKFGDLVSGLTNHRDVAVAEAACLLAQYWQLPVSIDFHPLPLTYRLALDGDPDHENALLDPVSGAMRIEVDLGWTQMLRPVARRLAELADCEEMNIRQRAATFIQQWGGLAAFGPGATKKIESQLRTLSMQITYLKPHAYIGILALRHVAGELSLAGLLSPRDKPSLLEQMDAVLPPTPRPEMQIRPTGIRRPLKVKDAPWSEAEEMWTNLVDEDVKPWIDRADEFVIAEVSQFKMHDTRRAEYQVYRISAPQIHISVAKFMAWYQSLPAVVWLGKMIPLDEDLAPTIVRRVVSSIGTMSSPGYAITLCPNIQMLLGWHESSEMPNIYTDKDSTIVARLVNWRDAGPVDIDDDYIWGEGCYLTLSKAGLIQIKTLFGEFTVRNFASRAVRQLRQGEAQMIKTAQNQFPIP